MAASAIYMTNNTIAMIAKASDALFFLDFVCTYISIYKKHCDIGAIYITTGLPDWLIVIPVSNCTECKATMNQTDSVCAFTNFIRCVVNRFCLAAVCCR